MRAEYDARLKTNEANLRKHIEAEAQTKFQGDAEDFKRKISLLQTQQVEKDKALAAANQREAELLQKETQLDNEKRELELTVKRKLSEERDNVYRTAKEKADEENRLKLEAERKRADDAIKAAEELKRRLEQGSQQAQGEILEINLEDKLRATFKTDEFSPVPKGISGGDLVQTIRGVGGTVTILWEFKNTKSWSDGWVEKIKANQRSGKHDLAAIVTRALPKDIINCGNKDGVWICDTDSLAGIAMALRTGLLDALHARASAEGRQQKMDMLYDYLAGTEFRSRISAVVEAFAQIQGDLSKEKIAMEKIWSSREKQLQKAILNMSGLYGDMQGIIGASLPNIQILELPPGDDAQPPSAASGS